MEEEDFAAGDAFRDGLTAFVVAGLGDLLRDPN
jgi:hypothetical protein